MIPYISMTASHSEVLRLYQDAIHPEIARRFEELVTAEDSAEKLTEKLCDVDSGLQEIDGLMDDINDLINDVESGALDHRTIKDREEATQEWCLRAQAAFEAVCKAIKETSKLTG
jgi:hypothetical protein